MSYAPKFTEQMTSHLNGGSSYSELHYRVYADGRETNIVHGVRTTGSPEYLVIDDVFRCGDDSFDRKATGGAGLLEWLTAHAATTEVKP